MFLEKCFTVDGPVEKQEVKVSASHNRVPLDKVKNLGDPSKGFDVGFPLWKKVEELRKSGDISKSILLYDEARESGYDAPGLYESYAMAYRKLKDYDNEIAITGEAIGRLSGKPGVNGSKIVKWKERIRAALDLRKNEMSKMN